MIYEDPLDAIMHANTAPITTYLDFLKRHVLGRSVVHHETIPARPQRLTTDLSHLPPGVSDILKTAAIPALYAHQAEGIAHALAEQPHHLVNMRTIEASWTIYAQGPPHLIGTVSGRQGYSECYDGAIYLHRGRQYLIAGRDPAQGQIYAREVDELRHCPRLWTAAHWRR